VSWAFSASPSFVETLMTGMRMSSDVPPIDGG
jgi:hypothetical protein